MDRWDHALEIMETTGGACVLPPSGVPRVYEQLLRRYGDGFEDLEQGVYVYDGASGGARIVCLAEFRADVEAHGATADFAGPPRMLKWQVTHPAL
jgi:hypothetical protein